MKEINSNTSATNKKLVPRFKTMGKQIGLPQYQIAAVLKEQKVRIDKLNYVSAYWVSIALTQDIRGRDGLWNVYGKLALILERCKYIPCGSRACAYCTAAQQLHYQGWDVTGKHKLYQGPAVRIDFFNLDDPNSSCHWDENKLVEMHGDGMLK